MNKESIVEKLKGLKTFLFTEHEKLKMKPIFLVVAAVVILAALYLFVLKGDGTSAPKETDTPTEQTDSNQTSTDESVPETKLSLSEKIDKFFNPVNDVTNNYATLQIPTITSEILEIDETLINDEKEEEPATEEPILAEEPVEEIVDFQVSKIDTSNSGRRDPMKNIVGDKTGTYDESRFSNLPADLKDESVDYFKGIGVEDIILDYVSTDELGDNKKRADFIIDGSYIPNLEEGDYLLEIYYVSKIDVDKKTATIQFANKAYVLGAKNIYHTSNKIETSSTSKGGDTKAISTDTGK